MSGDTRESVRGSGRVVVEVEGGITVYPPLRDGEPWRAVFTENGRRRYREAGSEEKLAAKLARVTERLQADAPHLERPGADLIAWYLCPDRHPAGRPWSRKHADTQRRLCARFAAPVIAAVPCQDIRVADMQQVVNAAPTAGEGARLRRCLSAMVTAGIAAGYLTAPGCGRCTGRPPAAARVITVDRKVVEVGGKLFLEAPKGRKRRSTIYPVRTPAGYPLAEKIAARAGQARAEQDAGANSLGLMLPSPRGAYWRSSNFDRRILAPAYRAAGWRDGDGTGTWTWHSLRHVFCTAALFSWRLEATDVSCMAGHANVRVTLDMYVRHHRRHPGPRPHSHQMIQLLTAAGWVSTSVGAGDAVSNHSGFLE